MTRDQRRAVAVEYFTRLDGGGDVLELFAEDAEASFPKWGVARGRAEVARMFSEVGQLFTRLRHHPESFTVVVDGDLVVVEGTSEGTTADGAAWRPGADNAAGRWCDVFEIRDFLIHRCSVYLDPDYGGRDTDRYPWLRTDRTAPLP